MWQRWYEQHARPDFVAVAADTQGAEAVRPWVERALASFPVAVDTANELGARLGYSVVPTGIFVDEEGTLRHLQAGDFSVNDAITRTRVERFLAGDSNVLEELTVEANVQPVALEQELIDAKLRLATELLASGRRDDALTELDCALELDPDNFVIRKQRWNIRYPERFEPEIDLDWQKHQLAREREAERQVREQACGSTGCPIAAAPPPALRRADAEAAVDEATSDGSASSNRAGD